MSQECGSCHSSAPAPAPIPEVQRPGSASALLVTAVPINGRHTGCGMGPGGHPEAHTNNMHSCRGHTSGSLQAHRGAEAPRLGLWHLHGNTGVAVMESTPPWGSCQRLREDTCVCPGGRTQQSHILAPTPKQEDTGAHGPRPAFDHHPTLECQRWPGAQLCSRLIIPEASTWIQASVRTPHFGSHTCPHRQLQPPSGSGLSARPASSRG
ncbi:uncharacterized protein LOC111170523 [Delphinapterus leucas]|uniref:Uncharacterized protein LOC111170523 n=1 Tax=Delphinapterus leucas TaxID=9749 RepID=A0A2Y9MQV8_DELLE|nr:uncharacterized protein LOC111170523 [Delphinapterus leucas]